MTGLKALVKIADTKKYREHFTALQEELNCDKSGINESRVCYESYDPDIGLYIMEQAQGIIRRERQTQPSLFGDV